MFNGRGPVTIGASTPNNRGVDMKSLFIEGLKEARKLIVCGCTVEELDALIAQFEADALETASVLPDLETR